MTQIATATKIITQIALPVEMTATAMLAQPPVKLPDRIIIGALIPLSGIFANEGGGYLGIMVAIKWVNEVYDGVNLYGRAIPLEVKFYDDESKRENTVSYTERLIMVDKVNFCLEHFRHT